MTLDNLLRKQLRPFHSGSLTLRWLRRLIPLLLAKVSFLPGGIGIVEATMTAIYVSLGAPTDVTVVVILIYRMISFWIPTLLGFPLALYLQLTAQARRSTQA